MKLSIITINYNNANGLRTTIENVVPKLIADVEYIIIDGGSTDGGLDVIEQYADKIDYWVSESDSGVYNAMNKGIKQAKGDYLIFMNSGDSFRTEILFEDILKDLESGEDLIYYNLEFVEDKGSHIKTYPHTLDFKFFSIDTISHQATLIKKEPLIDYGCYDEKMKIASDWVYFIDAVCKRNATYKYVEKCLSVFIADGLSCLPEYRAFSIGEIKSYLTTDYAPYVSLYEEWKECKRELHVMRLSRAIKYLQRVGLFRWFKVY